MSSPPPSRGRLARLADFAFRRRRAVLVAWIAGLVAAFGATALAGDFSADYSTPGSESRAAAELLKERFPQQSPDTVDVVWQAPAGAGTPAVRARIDRLVAQSRGLEGIGGSASAGADLARRHDRRAAHRARRAAGRGARQHRQDDDRPRAARERRRPARRARRPGHRQRAAGRDLLGGHRHHDRGARAAADVRLAGRRRAAAGHGAVRARDLLGASSACSPRSRRCPTGRRRSRRCSASAWGSTTRC